MPVLFTFTDRTLLCVVFYCYASLFTLAIGVVYALNSTSETHHELVPAYLGMCALLCIVVAMGVWSIQRLDAGVRLVIALDNDKV